MDNSWTTKLEDAIRYMLVCLPIQAHEREGMGDTPARVVGSYLELLQGYQMQVDLKQFDSVRYGGIVVVKGIKFYSLCEHHLLPFYGTVDIGYIPDGPVVGLSKLARVVDMFSHRLQVQERLTGQICDYIRGGVEFCKGVIVVVRATHMCMAMRGVGAQGAETVTSEVRGDFEDGATRAEFFALTG